MVEVQSLPFLPDEEINSLLHYVVIFICIFICCLLGSFIRDAIYASKNGLKIDIKSLLLYDVPCASVIAALSDAYSNKIHISGWAFISLFIGIWSREFVAMLMNSRIVTIIIRFAFGRAVDNAKASLSDDEKESLKNVFKNALNDATSEDEENKKISDDDLPGEFEWIEILEK